MDKLINNEIEDQTKFIELVMEAVDNDSIDDSSISKLIPLFVKTIASEDPIIQEKVAYILDNFILHYLIDGKENAQLFINENGTSNLLECIKKCSNVELIILCLNSLLNITFYFPDEIIIHDGLSTIIDCLKLKNPEIQCFVAGIINNATVKSNQNIPPIVEASGVGCLINILQSKNPKVFASTLAALINIMCFDAQTCEYVLNMGILNTLEEIFELLFGSKRGKCSKSDAIEIPKKSKIKSFAIHFILNVTASDAKNIDLILNKNFIPFILKLIGSKSSNEIKTDSIYIIHNIIEKKPSFINQLIEDDVISLLYKNFKTDDWNLLEAVVRTLYKFIKYSGYSEIVQQKINDCGNPEIFQNLFQFDKLQRISTDIFNFVSGNVEFLPGIIEKFEPNESDEHEEGHGIFTGIENDPEIQECENNSDAANSSNSASAEIILCDEQESETYIQNQTRKRKPSSNAPEQSEIYKKSRKDHEQSDTEEFVDDVQQNDIEDVFSGNFTPPVTSPTNHTSPSINLSSKKDTVLPPSSPKSASTSQTVSSSSSETSTSTKSTQTSIPKIPQQSNKDLQQLVTALIQKQEFFSKILNHTKYTDVILINSKGEEVPAFRCFLAHSSPVFEALFNSKQELPIRIEVGPFEKETMKQAVYFSQGDLITVTGNSMDLFKFAKKFGMGILMDCCFSSLAQTITVKNICDYLKFTYEEGLDDLKKKCLQFLKHNKLVVDPIKIKELSQEILFDAFLL